MNRRIVISLAVLVILIAAFLLLRQHGSGERMIPVFGIDSTAIAKIEIISPEDTIHIQQSPEGWRLSFPVAWDADSLQVSNFFRDVINAKYAKTIMTNSKDAVKRYGLDTKNALQVLVFDKAGKKRTHAYFSNSGNVYDYLRFDGSDDIYQMNRLISKTYGTGITDWRSPVIIRAAENEISSFEVSYPNGSYTLTHKGKDWIFRDTKVEFTVPFDNRALMRIINIMSHMDTRVFLEKDLDKYLPAFEKPVATVLVKLTDGKARKLVFAKTDDNQYILMMDDKNDTLYAMVNDTILRFTVNADDYLAIPYGSTPAKIKKL